ncbi:hypothetical protein AGMMS5026_10790 [Endomicrobiia bacterium]|nr:hypothetical protein AGMMS49523_10850 [Endomicrobiia bacterium]GHT09889.1 hypothetical protein AGMMS49532_08910 [Endomicrobiia bacterium]GHT29033.1 hypothetical protein AGMMS49995_10830 [Endomicrobiia bacterium]GHT32574.1 hypothetical protein AGMMS5026_10790 [Endomicrobiia bacterium]
MILSILLVVILYSLLYVLMVMSGSGTRLTIGLIYILLIILTNVVYCFVRVVVSLSLVLMLILLLVPLDAKKTFYNEYFEYYKKWFDSIDCKPLKEKFVFLDNFDS